MAQWRVRPVAVAVFFGCSPYLVWIGKMGEASHDRPVRTSHDDDVRIADQVEAVARWQAGSEVVAYGSLLPSRSSKRLILTSVMRPSGLINTRLERLQSARTPARSVY